MSLITQSMHFDRLGLQKFSHDLCVLGHCSCEASDKRKQVRPSLGYRSS